MELLSPPFRAVGHAVFCDTRIGSQPKLVAPVGAGSQKMNAPPMRRHDPGAAFEWRIAGRIGVLHVEDSPARLRGGHEPSLTKRRYKDTMSRATSSMVRTGRIPCRNLFASPGSSHTRWSVVRHMDGESGATRRPSTSWVTSSAKPPRRDPRTGTPAAKASKMTKGPVSNH